MVRLKRWDPILGGSNLLQRYGNFEGFLVVVLEAVGCY